MGNRLTCWFSDEERTEIQRVARELRSSENFVVRTSLRAALNLGDGEQMLRLLRVTSNTPDTTERSGNV